MVRRALLAGGMPPDARRTPGTSWKQFLAAHWSSLAAADFFTIEALTWHGLQHLHVPFVIELKSRAVEIAGIVAEPVIPATPRSPARPARSRSHARPGHRSAFPRG